MKRLLLFITLASLVLPVSALAAPRSAVLLSTDRANHTVQVVDGKHLVHRYRYRGRLPRLHVGSRISYQLSGRTLSHLSASPASARTVSFYARVLRSSSLGVVLRLADGSNVKFSPGQVKRVPGTAVTPGRPHPALARIAGRPRSVTLAIHGLEPGVTVLVNESVDGSGNVTITITLPPATASTAGSEQSAVGVIADFSADAIMLDTADGSQLRLHVQRTPPATTHQQVCDTVAVTYHQAAGVLVADTVQRTGASTSGDCGGEQPSHDVTGTITIVSATGLTVNTDRGPQSFTVDSPDITDGLAVGDVVDVTYTPAGASDVEYVEHDATGTVTAVDAGGLTISSGGGQPETFVADPSQGMFDGISVGDGVDVIYHQSAGQMVADVVDGSGA
jgi:hypothetical protein